MPPLLPEYLSLPLQIVVEAPETDWKAVIAGGFFTLLGAGIGAGLGAYFSYMAATRAQKKVALEEKRERILKLCEECKHHAVVIKRKSQENYAIKRSEPKKPLPNNLKRDEEEALIQFRELYLLVNDYYPQIPAALHEKLDNWNKSLGNSIKWDELLQEVKAIEDYLKK